MRRKRVYIIIAVLFVLSFIVSLFSGAKAKAGTLEEAAGIRPAVNLNTSLVLVNKFHSLEADYKPEDLTEINEKYKNPSRPKIMLTQAAAEAFSEMCAAAEAEGYFILGSSGYRSYDYQAELYSYYKENDPELADFYCARPGHSEHQTGLAIDVCSAGQTDYNCFGDTPEYQWAKDNIHKYGFIFHYTDANSHITGYKGEPWHLRYVGPKAAGEIFEKGIALEDYVELL